jgi:hypothetical protein
VPCGEPRADDAAELQQPVAAVGLEQQSTGCLTVRAGRRKPSAYDELAAGRDSEYVRWGAAQIQLPVLARRVAVTQRQLVVSTTLASAARLFTDSMPL